MFSEEERQAMLDSGPFRMPNGMKATLAEVNEDICEVRSKALYVYHTTWRQVRQVSRSSLRRFSWSQLRAVEQQEYTEPSAEDFQTTFDYIVWLQRQGRLQ
jgi:hypothetical protein